MISQEASFIQIIQLLMLYKDVKIVLDSNGFLLSFSDTTRSFGGPSHRSKTKHRSKFAHQTLL